MSARHIPPVVALALTVAACAAAPAAHDSQPTMAPTAATATVAPPPPPASAGTMPPGPGDWARWTHEQKYAYMSGPFMDAERKLFQGWMPERFRDVNCRTCHGVGVTEGSFRLPNPDLPIVAPGAAGFQELAKHEPEVLGFMQKTVVPETARLLGVPAFDMESHVGFSCYQCHVRGEGK
jgi:hypothetical protein